MTEMLQVGYELLVNNHCVEKSRHSGLWAEAIPEGRAGRSAVLLPGASTEESIARDSPGRSCKTIKEPRGRFTSSEVVDRHVPRGRDRRRSTMEQSEAAQFSVASSAAALFDWISVACAYSRSPSVAGARLWLLAHG